jgi:cephalosporin hydroxylase
MPGPYLGQPGESDKGPNGYIPTYQALTRTLPARAAICELGVYEGGSLKLWQQMFPQYAVIVGVDIDPNATWPPGTVKVVTDQQDPALPDTLARVLASEALGHRGYDMIVDDASHNGHLTFKSFQHLWPLVVPGGYYVIEDWCVGFPMYENYDDSMLSLAMMLLSKFATPDTDTHFVTYSYGMIVLRKRDEVRT